VRRRSAGTVSAGRRHRHDVQVLVRRLAVERGERVDVPLGRDERVERRGVHHREQTIVRASRQHRGRREHRRGQIELYDDRVREVTCITSR